MLKVLPIRARNTFFGPALLFTLLLIALASTLGAQCFADGGRLSLEEGGNILITCADDGESDAFTPIVTGAEGDNFAWVIATASGNILAVPPGPTFDLEGQGPGACFLYQIAFADGFTGVIAPGTNICNYTADDGCFDISNHITINRKTGDECDALVCAALSSEIALTDGSTSTSICVDGTPDPLDIVMSGPFEGQNTTFIITDAATGEILGIPPGLGPFNLDGAGPGTCVIWYLAYEDGLTGLAVGQNADDLEGCFDLSNGVVVARNAADAGSISLADGSSATSICVDDVPDPLTVIMSGDVSGDNSTFFITDQATGEILGVPGNNGPFDLNGAGIGVCGIWYLSAFGDVAGLVMGGNISEISGCFDLSNPIVVTREDCCMVDGGNIFTDAPNAHNLVVVANRGSATISVLNADSNESLGDFAFPGGGQPMYVVHNATNNTVLVGDYEGRVVAYDAFTFDVTGEVAVGNGVFHMWMSDDRTQLWTNNELDRNISVVNPTTLENLGTIELPADLFDLGYRPHDVIFSPDNQSAFVTVLNTLEQDFVIRYDVATQAETHRVGVGLDPHVSLTSANDLLYVAAQFSSELTIFNRADLTEVTRFDIPTAHGLGMSPDGSYLYIGNIAGGGDSAIYTLDLATNTLVGEPVDAPNTVPHNLAVLNGQLYLTHSSGANNVVSIYDLTPTPVLNGTITVGSNPFGLAAFSATTTTEVTICVDDIADPIAVTMDGTGSGPNSSFFITDAATGEILGVPPGNGPFDLNGAGIGTCDIWYVAYEDGLTGLTMGGNIADLAGCFDLSNPVTVVREGADAGAISLDGGATEATICVDGVAAPLTVVMSGETSGDNFTFFITDAATGEILGVPGNNGPFDLDGAGGGVCEIWYLASVGDVTGVTMGGNIADIAGCFDLSNPITVTRNAAEAGSIALEGGATEVSICVDDVADPLTVVMSGDVAGDNSTFFITDQATGEILGVPGNNGPFDLNGAGAGVCDIWYLAAFGDVTGLVMGGNISDIAGCFDLSNPIVVDRVKTEAGTIELADGTTEATICVDGVPDPLEVLMDGVVVGANRTFVITDADGEILGIPGNNGPFDLDGAGPGTCLIWYLAFEDGLEGAEVGMNANDLVGCFDLSNPITVIRNEADAGSIALADGTAAATICAGDGEADPMTVVMSGEVAGDNSTFFITDQATGEILGVPGNNGPFDLDGAGGGICDIWHLSSFGDVTGLVMGGNIDDIAGCFDLSNPIVVTRNTGADCDGAVDGGAITLADGTTAATICVDGVADPLEVIRDGNGVGENRTFIITDTNTGEILGIPGNNGPFDLDPAGGGTCDIWYLAYNGDITGLAAGNNLSDLMGDFDLSNAIVVTRNEADAGSIALEDGTAAATICAGDGTGDPLTVVLSGDVAGDNSTFFITDQATGEILGVPGNNGPFDLDGAGGGICDIWYLSSFGDVTGLVMGGNIADIAGCFDLSNPIVVTRNTGADCDGGVSGGAITLADGTTATIICVDGVADPLEVIRDGNGVGENRTFIITDAATGEILGIPGNNGPFDLDPAGGGTCDIWYLAYNGDITGLATGNTLSDLMGDFDLSNAIVVTRNEADAGSIALEDGTAAATICAGDGTGDPLTVVMSGDVAGDNATFFITDQATGEILGVPGNNGPFDLDGAGGGVCDIWYLSSFGDVTGLVMGGNIADIAGCFDLSNPIVVTRNVGADCDGGGFNFTNVVINEVAADGMIELFNGTDSIIDVSSYWVCNFPTYVQVSSLTLECGNLLMQPGDITVISGFSAFDATDAELGLYTTNSFGSATALVSYLEWGSTGHQRSSVAVAAGIWATGQVADAPTANQSVQLSINDSDELSYDLADPTLCSVNNATTTTGTPGTQMSISVFPNPVQGNMLNLVLDGMSGEMMRIQVIDINGRQLYNSVTEMGNGPMELNLPSAPAGTYFVRVVNNGSAVTERFSRF